VRIQKGSRRSFKEEHAGKAMGGKAQFTIQNQGIESSATRWVWEVQDEGIAERMYVKCDGVIKLRDLRDERSRARKIQV